MTNDPITLPPDDVIDALAMRFWPMEWDGMQYIQFAREVARAAVLADRAEREGPTLPGPEGPTIPADEGPDDDQRKGGPPEVTRAMLLAAEGIFRKNGVEFSPCLAGEVWRAMQAARAAAPLTETDMAAPPIGALPYWKEDARAAAPAGAEPVAWMVEPIDVAHKGMARELVFYKPANKADWVIVPLYAAPPGGSREAAWRAFAKEHEEVERLRALLRLVRDDLANYHQSDDDRISVAMGRIDAELESKS